MYRPLCIGAPMEARRQKAKCGHVCLRVYVLFVRLLFVVHCQDTETLLFRSTSLLPS